LKIDPVETHLIVDNALKDTATALGFKMDHDQRRLMTEDIIKKYTHDSIEDVLSALETIRQGEIKIYKLNMVTIAEAMSVRLEQKAEDRERSLEQQKQPRADADATEGQLRAMSVIHTGGVISRIKQALQKIRGRRV